jgi:hypothetical protein
MKDMYNFKEMKSPILCLKFKDIGYVTVMQMSLYVMSNSRRDVINMSHEIANVFQAAGLQVVREKIEATAFGLRGIPITQEEVLKWNKYFEYHLRVCRADGNLEDALTDEELSLLEDISKRFCEDYARFNTRVPLSYNKTREAQRYLNARFDGMTRDEAYGWVKKIRDAINETGVFKVMKIISEWVWYDTMRPMDAGWIDFPAL